MGLSEGLFLSLPVVGGGGREWVLRGSPTEATRGYKELIEPTGMCSGFPAVLLGAVSVLEWTSGVTHFLFQLKFALKKSFYIF